MVRDIRRLDAALTDIATRMTVVLDEYDTELLDVDGVGPVLGARLIGRTGRASRFPTPDAFANYTGVAPIEVASGQHPSPSITRR
jgi:transposase